MDMDDDALPQFMMEVSECGLDVNQMATSMFAMVGQLGAAGEEDEEIEFPVLDPNSFFVGAQDEPTCSITQEMQMTKAFVSFGKCT
eukprot:scaffold306219_cov47-Attheya_sp.AAC.1